MWSKNTHTTSVNYLGITLDESLAWTLQVSILITKLARATGIISKLRYYVSYKCLLSVYHALFQSHINYCIQNFGYITTTTMNKICVLQNKIMRIIHFKQHRDSARPLYIQSNILPIEKWLKLRNCLFAFDQQRNKVPAFFNNFCSPVTRRHNHNTKSAKNELFINMTRTVTYGSCSIRKTIAKHWNVFLKTNLRHHIKAFLILNPAKLNSLFFSFIL